MRKSELDEMKICIKDGRGEDVLGRLPNSLSVNTERKREDV